MRYDPPMGSYEFFLRRFEAEKVHWWLKGIQEISARILDVHCGNSKNLKILDAGCGTGVFLSSLQRYTVPANVIGIDQSKHALEFSRTRGNFPLCRSSVIQLPFHDGYFDLVICNGVLQYLTKDSDSAALIEFSRVLKPGGSLFVRTISSQGLARHSVSGDGFRMYSVSELGNKIQNAGFHILKLTCANILLSIIPTISRYLKTRKDPIYSKPNQPRKLSRSLNWINSCLYWLMKGEAWFLSRPNSKSSFGMTIICVAQKISSA